MLASSSPLSGIRLNIPPFVKARTVLEGLQSHSEEDKKDVVKEEVGKQRRLIHNSLLCLALSQTSSLTALFLLLCSLKPSREKRE